MKTKKIIKINKYKNKKSASTIRGWYLLSLVLGCFPPSEKLEKYLENFILNNGVHGYQSYCWLRLKKICNNRNFTRSTSPCGLELAAAKEQSYISITIVTENQKKVEVQVESATLIEEMIEKVALSLNLKHSIGFNIYRNGFFPFFFFFVFHWYVNI